jgi:hypothetical protein
VTASLGLEAAVEAIVAIKVEARIAELGRPALVCQRTVERVVGMPGRDYLRHCRAGDWPSFADRRLRYSRTTEVLGWIEAQRSRRVADAPVSGEFLRGRSGVRRIAR